MKLVHTVDGWAVTSGTARRGLNRPLLVVPNVTAHPSTVSVSIIVLLYNGPLLCGFNASIKGLNCPKNFGNGLANIWGCYRSTLQPPLDFGAVY